MNLKYFRLALEREIAILKIADNPHIVRLLDTIKSERDVFLVCVCIFYILIYVFMTLVYVSKRSAPYYR